MSVQRLHNLYLPPFKAAIDAGSDTAMCSFNSINGVAGCGNKELETDLLKQQWGFDGFIESDYTAVAELRTCPPKTPDTGPCGHGVAEDGPGAAALALNAGTDSEMVSTNIRDYGSQLLAQQRISQSRIDDAVRRILRVKFRAGLFKHPYVDDPSKAESAQLLPDAVAAARRAAGRSMVLLKNEGANGPTLPLSTDKKTAVIGPLAKNGHDMLGPWWGKGRDEDAVTVFDGIKAQSSQPTTYAEGCTIADIEPPKNTPADECGSEAGFGAAVAAANAADQIVLALGESGGQSGEAASRSEIDLPGRQEELDHRDIPSCEPQYPFGFGLSYSRFETSNLQLSGSKVSSRGKVRASVDVTNVSGPKGDEVVQLYIHDPVASISQPVRRLRGFERVTLTPGEKRKVTFTLDRSDFGFYDNRGSLVVEPGPVDVYAGNSSKADLKQSFMVTG